VAGNTGPTERKARPSLCGRNPTEDEAGWPVGLDWTGSDGQAGAGTPSRTLDCHRWPSGSGLRSLADRLGTV